MKVNWNHCEKNEREKQRLVHVVASPLQETIVLEHFYMTTPDAVLVSRFSDMTQRSLPNTNKVAAEHNNVSQNSNLLIF